MEANMAYTPELNDANACTLRRIAWALDIPMTKAMGYIFDYLTEKIDPNRVCAKCKDRTRCADCGFYRS